MSRLRVATDFSNASLRSRSVEEIEKVPECRITPKFTCFAIYSMSDKRRAVDVKALTISEISAGKSLPDFESQVTTSKEGI